MPQQHHGSYQGGYTDDNDDDDDDDDDYYYYSRISETHHRDTMPYSSTCGGEGFICTLNRHGVTQDDLW